MDMRAVILILATAAALATAPAALAATLTTDTRCYQETQDIVVSGTGYAPMGAVSIARDGIAFGTANADATGNFQAKFPAAELGRDQREAVSSLTATDGALNTASTRYRTTKVFADFDADSGDPKTLTVRFSVNGFGLLRRHASVYLHYISPGGKLRRDVRLGTALGTCGVIRKTRERHLFPFPAERGRWILQFDTNKKYTRATSKSPYIWVRKPVEIFTK
jgi:hypothetical protein